MTSGGMGGWDLVSPIIHLYLPESPIPAPGNGGTAIVGSTELPAELQGTINYAGASYIVQSAIIWYSNANDLALRFVKYQFMAYAQNTSLSASMEIWHGYADTAGHIFVHQVWGAGDTSGGGNETAFNKIGGTLISLFPDDTTGTGRRPLLALRQLDGPIDPNFPQTTGAIQAWLRGGVGAGSYDQGWILEQENINTKALQVWSQRLTGPPYNNVGSWYAQIGTSWITSPFDPTVDVWLGPLTSTGNDGQGNTYTASWWYRKTFDRMVDVRINIVWNTSPVSGNVDLVVPAGIPFPEQPPGYPNTNVVQGTFITFDGTNYANIPPTAYTPVITGATTNPTVTSATGTYQVNNGLCTGTFNITLNNVGSGFYNIAAPVIPRSGVYITGSLAIGTGYVINASPVQRGIGAIGFTAPATGLMRLTVPTDFVGGITNVGNTTPFTLTTGSQVMGSYSYLVDAVNPSGTNPRLLMPFFANSATSPWFIRSIVQPPIGSLRWFGNISYSLSKPAA